MQHANFMEFAVTKATAKIQSFKICYLARFIDTCSRTKMTTMTFINSSYISCSCIHSYLELPHGVAEAMNYECKAHMVLATWITLIWTALCTSHYVILYYTNTVFKLIKPPICLMTGSFIAILCSIFNSDTSVICSNLMPVFTPTLGGKLLLPDFLVPNPQWRTMQGKKAFGLAHLKWSDVFYDYVTPVMHKYHEKLEISDPQKCNCENPVCLLYSETFTLQKTSCVRY